MDNWREKINRIQIEGESYQPQFHYRMRMNYDVPVSITSIVGDDFLRQQLDDLIIAVQLDPLRKLPQAISEWIANELGIE